jgi:hypothetical protein
VIGQNLGGRESGAVESDLVIGSVCESIPGAVVEAVQSADGDGRGELSSIEWEGNLRNLDAGKVESDELLVHVNRHCIIPRGGAVEGGASRLRECESIDPSPQGEISIPVVE